MHTTKLPLLFSMVRSSLKTKPRLLCDIVMNMPHELIATSPELVIAYVDYTNLRFSLGESILVKPYYLYKYLSSLFIKGTDEQEAIIAQSAYYSYRYARDVLRKPFPLGENAIATDSYASLFYAKHVLVGPFSLGEKAIKSNINNNVEYQLFLDFNSIHYH